MTSILVRNSLDSSDRVRLTEKKHSLKLLSVSYYTQWMHYENLHRISVLLTHLSFSENRLKFHNTLLFLICYYFLFLFQLQTYTYNNHEQIYFNFTFHKAIT